MEHPHTSWLLIVTLTLVVGSCKKEDDTPAPATGTNSPSYPPGYPSTVTDIDGNVYFTVSIGEQLWMAENLRTTHYADGTEIPLAETISSWTGQGAADLDAMCAYDNDPDNAAIYGYLYNWYSATNALGICPQGWHVPTDEEWKELETAMGMPFNELDDVTGHRGSNQNIGGRLKSTSTLWVSPNIGATNASGFSAIPGGLRYGLSGNNSGIGTRVCFHSASESSDLVNPAIRELSNSNAGVPRRWGSKGDGCCVRCVAD